MSDIKRDASGRVIPGQKLNPSGRAKGFEDVRKAARGHSKIAIKTLAEIVKDKDAPKNVRVTAACALLDRGWGKPAQHVELPAQPEGENRSRYDIGRRVAHVLLEALASVQQEPEPQERRTN